MTAPLISVCIPSYNCEQYIGETISCLLQQSYQELEVIVVDDGSGDATKDILASIADPRLKYSLQQKKGAAAARNVAFSLSTGDYIKFMDADDLINPGCIEAQLDRISKRPGCVASAGWGRFFASDASDFKLAKEKVWNDLPGIDWLINSLMDTGANMMQPGIFLIPRNIVERSGLWDESLSLIDDFEYMVRILSNSNYVLFCEDAVLMYRSGITNNLSGKRTREHMSSAFESLKAGIHRILEVKNDSQSRKACANTYKRWAYTFYPYHKDLYHQLEVEIEKLGGSNVPIPGGKLFHLLSDFIGWKKAKMLKILMGRKVY